MSLSDDRFQPASLTLIIDRFMTHFIKIGGLAVIAAVMGIFVFIFLQVIPLFRGATVTELDTIDLRAADAVVLGADQWTELPFAMSADGTLQFYSVPTQKESTYKLEMPDERPINSLRYIPRNQQIAVGSEGGFLIVDLNFKAEFAADESRTIHHNIKMGPFYSAGLADVPIDVIDYSDGESTKTAALVQKGPDGPVVHAVTLKQKRSLLGAGKIKIVGNQNLSPDIPGKPTLVRVSIAGHVMVATDNGKIIYFKHDGDEYVAKQTFVPFGNSAASAIASMDFLLGGNSLVVSNADGDNRIFSLFLTADDGGRQFGQTKTFPPLPGGIDAYAISQRNKSFVAATGRTVSLRYGTTETIRWEKELPFNISRVALSGKNDRLLLLDDTGKLHLYGLTDPHPEAGFKAFFGKIWYEGASKPEYTWQSTGGSDDFEPKLSMIPLIVGTLKGTLYAMLFAIPIALLAAVYTSQFQHGRFKAVVKPTMEIMASIPSVVLGFLAALWLAPILEAQFPAVLVFLIITPTAAMVIGYVWTRMPPHVRVWCKPGYEFLVFLPVLILCFYMSAVLGPIIESVAFVVTDPDTGIKTADFRLWWPEFTGGRYEQRNAMIVGFMMGFAVIPIIFTIAEDSLSNVPRALTSASLALGASRWQTAVRVVVPTAAAGIFSGVMIGLGRAVGETMIVLMATGNTPITGMSFFTGMRTLSANIAVELPEAPHGGTLYRSLFLGAVLLFMMTFVLNTAAELLRQHLRNKYKTV